MEAYTIETFAKKYFGTVAAFAEHINRPANSLYRLSKKGAVVVLKGDRITLFKNGEVHSLSEKATWWPH